MDAAFWIFLLLHVLVLWVFPYVPTEDGPVHVATSVALREIEKGSVGYSQWFDCRRHFVPNLASFYILRGLLYLAPPPIAEKLLLTIYVVGLPVSFRMFLRSFPQSYRGAAVIVFLFVYSQAFFWGFYSFCLSEILLWILLTILVRRHARSNCRDLAMATGFLTLTYFTHLVGFLVAVAAASSVTCAVPAFRWRNVGLVAMASAPGAVLTVQFLMEAGTFCSDAGYLSVNQETLPWVCRASEAAASETLRMLCDVANTPFWQHHLGWVCFFFACVLVSQCGRRSRDGSQRESFARIAKSLAVLALLFVTAVFVVPDHFGRQGGFLHCRLLAVAPLMGAVILQRPVVRSLRLVCEILMCLAVLADLLGRVQYFQRANHDLSEFTAALGTMGAGRRVVLLRRPRASQEAPDYLANADAYYCLNDGNIMMDNYQARGDNFPITIAPANSFLRDGASAIVAERAADVVLVWDYGSTDPQLPSGYRLTFARGRLRVFRLSGGPATDRGQQSKRASPKAIH